MVIKFEYPESGEIDPAFYEINQETEEKIKSKIVPIIQKSGDKYVARWPMQGITKGQTYRVEW